MCVCVHVYQCMSCLCVMQEFDPTKIVPVSQMEPVVVTATRHTEGKAEEPASNYHDKYKHIIGDTCAEKSAVKMEPNKVFGYG